MEQYRLFNVAEVEKLHGQVTDLLTVLRSRGKPVKEEVGWLIEQPADDNLPVRWWHPKGGWMMDAAKAIRFARKEDGEAYAESSFGLRGRPVTEHIFL